MKITAALFETYLKCPTKCYLYSRGEIGSGNGYADWSKTRNESYRSEGTKRLVADIPPAQCSIGPPATENPKQAKWKLAVDLIASATHLETTIHALQKVPSAGRGQAAQLVPMRFVPANKLAKDHKLLMAFDILALSGALSAWARLSMGRIRPC